jgi:hypothetical protein
MFGYDYYLTPEYDESYYIETIKPMQNKEKFNNLVDNIINNDEEDITVLQNKCNQKESMCNTLVHHCNKYKQIIYGKSMELKNVNMQLFLFYILLFVAVFIILYQRVNVANMKQLIYILEMQLVKKN